MAESGNSYQKIYEIVKQIPKGCVASYGQVAALAGNPRWARVVGYALHVNPGSRAYSLLPCGEPGRQTFGCLCIRRCE